MGRIVGDPSKAIHNANQQPRRAETKSVAISCMHGKGVITGDAQGGEDQVKIISLSLVINEMAGSLKIKNGCA